MSDTSPRPGFLERLAYLVAPGLALKRDVSRARAEPLRLRMDTLRRWAHAPGARRRYDAASMGRRTSGWRGPGSSANAEVGPALDLLRARARELVRNTPWATQAVRCLAGEVVGEGVRPTMRVRPLADTADSRREARRVGDQVADVWEAWAETTEVDPDGRHTIYGLQELAMRACAEGGEVLVRRRTRRSTDGMSVPLQLQLLEGDHLDTAKTGTLPNGNRVIQGVEFNRRGYTLR